MTRTDRTLRIAPLIVPATTIAAKGRVREERDHDHRDRLASRPAWAANFVSRGLILPGLHSVPINRIAIATDRHDLLVDQHGGAKLDANYQHSRICQQGRERHPGSSRPRTPSMTARPARTPEPVESVLRADGRWLPDCTKFYSASSGAKGSCPSVNPYADVASDFRAGRLYSWPAAPGSILDGIAMAGSAAAVAWLCSRCGRAPMLGSHGTHQCGRVPRRQSPTFRRSQIQAGADDFSPSSRIRPVFG